MPQSSVKGIYKCPNCAREYLHRGSLRQHIKLECGKEPQLQCPYCPKKTKLKGNLKQHILLVHESPLAKRRQKGNKFTFRY